LLGGGLQPMPGFETLVATLQRGAFPYGVATSSRRHFAEQILRRDALLDQLAFLLTGDDVQRGKPHPEMYAQAAARLQIPASSLLVLEDSENGCAAAVAAGAIAVAVTGEHVSGHVFPGAALQVHRLDDPRLLAWLR